MATLAADQNGADRREEIATWCQQNDPLLIHIAETTASQADLVDDLEHLREMMDGAAGLRSAMSALVEAREAAAQVKEALKRCQAAAELLWKPTAKSAVKAQQVFDLPELVEEIFSYLPTWEVLSATQSQRALSRVVSGSTKLKQTLGLERSKSISFSSPFAGLCTKSVQCNIEDRNSFYISADRTKGTINFCFLTRALPHIGSRWRKTLICSPPIFEMQVDVRCCSRSRYHRSLGALRVEPQPLLSVNAAEGGITMGHVHDHAAKLMAEHQLCPFAEDRDLDDDGSVNVRPSFSATVRLRPDRRIVILRRAWVAGSPVPWSGSPAETTPELTGEELKKAYTWAKRAAFNAGETIPTLELFKAREFARRASEESSKRDSNVYGAGEEAWKPDSDV